VFLPLQPYNQTSIKMDHYHKISPNFYGSYTILKHVGPMAYKLALPDHSKLHPVFHVSCLKEVIGTKCHIQTSFHELHEEGSIWLQHQAVLDQHEHCLR
jgi:hypothetical protein